MGKMERKNVQLYTLFFVIQWNMMVNEISCLSLWTFWILLWLLFLFPEYKSTHSKEKEYADISDVLLWSIFANRKELAEICWLRSENQLCTFFLWFKDQTKSLLYIFLNANPLSLCLRLNGIFLHRISLT